MIRHSLMMVDLLSKLSRIVIQSTLQKTEGVVCPHQAKCSKEPDQKVGVCINELLVKQLVFFSRCSYVHNPSWPSAHPVSYRVISPTEFCCFSLCCIHMSEEGWERRIEAIAQPRDRRGSSGKNLCHRISIPLSWDCSKCTAPTEACIALYTFIS